MARSGPRRMAAGSTGVAFALAAARLRTIRADGSVPSPAQHALRQEQLGNLLRRLDEQRVAARREPARARQSDLEHLLDAAGARRHHDHAVGEQHRLVDRVGDEQHGLAGLHPQVFQIDAHLLARQRIERAERLVHQQQRRIVDQRAHDRGALAHAAGEFARAAVVEFGEADLGEQLVRARDVSLRVEPAQLELQHHVAEDVAPFEQHRALEHDAEIGLRARDLACRRAARCRWCGAAAPR